MAKSQAGKRNTQYPSIGYKYDFVLCMRLETASASSVANSELDLCDIPSSLEVVGRDVRISPKHSMHTDKCHLIRQDKQEPNLCPTGHSGQSQVLGHEPRCQPTTERKSCLTLCTAPQGTTALATQRVKSQTLQFTAFLAVISTALNL